MPDSLRVADIRFAEASAPSKSNGLLGWVTCSCGALQLHGLQVRQTEMGRHVVGFPSRTDANGVMYPIVRPLDQAARDSIEAQVLGELRRRGILPSNIPTPHSQTPATSKERLP